MPQKQGVTVTLNHSLWYWCAYEIDIMHGWPHAAICEVENDGEGFPVRGSDIAKGKCTIIKYTAKRDGVTREIVVDGWEDEGQPATRIRLFGKEVLFPIRTEYGNVKWDSLTKEQQACIKR